MTNPILLFFIFSVVTGFFCFATSENFHLSKSSDNAFLFRKLCILSLISDQKLHFLYMYNQNSNNDALVVLFAISSIKANLLKLEIRRKKYPAMGPSKNSANPSAPVAMYFIS